MSTSRRTWRAAAACVTCGGREPVHEPRSPCSSSSHAAPPHATRSLALLDQLVAREGQTSDMTDLSTRFLDHGYYVRVREHRQRKRCGSPRSGTRRSASPYDAEWTALVQRTLTLFNVAEAFNGRYFSSSPAPQGWRGVTFTTGRRRRWRRRHRAPLPPFPAEIRLTTQQLGPSGPELRSASAMASVQALPVQTPATARRDGLRVVPLPAVESPSTSRLSRRRSRTSSPAECRGRHGRPAGLHHRPGEPSFRERPGLAGRSSSRTCAHCRSRRHRRR